MADLTRRTFLKGAALAGGVVVRPPAVLGQAKPFAGVTIRGSSFQHVFHTYLKEYLPEFEAKTGMTVDFAPQAFPAWTARDRRAGCTRETPAARSRPSSRSSPRTRGGTPSGRCGRRAGTRSP